MDARGMRMRASPRTISPSVSSKTVASASRTVPLPSSTRPRHFASYPMSRLRGGDHRRCRFASELAAERAQIAVDRRGVAHDETRNEAKDGVVDRAALGDRHHASAGAIRLDAILPLAAVRQI